MQANTALPSAPPLPEIPPAKSPGEHLKAFLDKPEDTRNAGDYANARFYNDILRGKVYTGPGIVDGINESETLDEVDGILRLAVREATADRKTVQRWLAAAALRRLALCKTRDEVFSVTLQAGKPLTLRDGRSISLRSADRTLVTQASTRRLLKLDTAAIGQRGMLVDVSGKPLQAAA